VIAGLLEDLERLNPVSRDCCCRTGTRTAPPCQAPARLFRPGSRPSRRARKMRALQSEDFSRNLGDAKVLRLFSAM